MAQYRVIQYWEKLFVPQIRRWWWPFWVPLYDEVSAGTLEEAEKLCHDHKYPAPGPLNIVHDVQIP